MHLYFSVARRLLVSVWFLCHMYAVLILWYLSMSKVKVPYLKIIYFFTKTNKKIHFLWFYAF